MIFVTVGSQMPFDRLITAVDEWAGRNPGCDVFAQIAASSLRPRNIRYTKFMIPEEFAQALHDAQLIVGHAGMGTIISALELGKQLVVMPRLGKLHETRNDHQVATARHFAAQGRVIVADDELHLPVKLDYAMTFHGSEPIETQASPHLLATIRAFLEAPPVESRVRGQVHADNPDAGFVPVSQALRGNLTTRQTRRHTV
jgi:UDP-N-acetylglucosamine transferase subunit ALG13